MGNYNVGDMIRLSRIAKKMTQEELAERAGLHPTYIGPELKTENIK